MSRYRHEIDNARIAHIVSLWLVSHPAGDRPGLRVPRLGQCMADIAASRRTFRPGRYRARRRDPRPNVYGFGYPHVAAAQRWPRDGAEDFPAKLYHFARLRETRPFAPG